MWERDTNKSWALASSQDCSATERELRQLGARHISFFFSLPQRPMSVEMQTSKYAAALRMRGRSGSSCMSSCQRISRGQVWVLTIALSMAFIDSTVVTVALPVLQTELNANGMLRFSGYLPSPTRLSRHLSRGSQAITMGGGIYFALAQSSGLLPNVNQSHFRASQFRLLGGALLTPRCLKIISASFSSEQRDKHWHVVGLHRNNLMLGPVPAVGWLSSIPGR